MNNVCVFCGKKYDDAPIYHDWPYDHLNVEGMYCWECYHKEAIKIDVAAFGLSEIGHNAGWTYRYTLADAIHSALEMTDDNLDQGIGIDAPIGGSYTASLIVRNGSLYLRIADLYPLMESKNEDEKRLLIDEIISQLSWEVKRPMPKTEDNEVQS